MTMDFVTFGQSNDVLLQVIDITTPFIV